MLSRGYNGPVPQLSACPESTGPGPAKSRMSPVRAASLKRSNHACTSGMVSDSAAVSESKADVTAQYCGKTADDGR